MLVENIKNQFLDVWSDQHEAHKLVFEQDTKQAKSSILDYGQIVSELPLPSSVQVP